MKRAHMAIISLAAAFAAHGDSAVQTGATMTFSERSFIVKDANGNERTFAAGESLCPTQEPAAFLIKPVLAANEHLFGITGGDKMHGATFYRYPLADGWVPFAPFASAESNMTVKAVIATGVIYADAEHGKDEWDGSADYEHRDEATGKGPKQSLQAAYDVATMDYELVYVAPGTYSNGVSTVTAEKSGVTYTCRRRLYATRPIGFRSTGGAEVTFIVGESDPNPESTGLTPVEGCGDNAIAGVQMSSSGYQFLQGFTITGCHTPNREQSHIHFGAAFCSGAYRASMVDCIVSNNYAYSGPTASYGVHYRCKFFENESHQFAAGSYGQFHSCVFAANRINSTSKDQGGRAYVAYPGLFNCTIDMRSPKNPTGRLRFAYDSTAKAYNCIVIGYLGTETGCFVNSLTSGDPLFADADARDFRLASLSPAADCAAYADLPDEVRRGDGTDLNGNFAAVRNGKATLGAVQSPVLASVAILGHGDETVSGGYSLGTNIVAVSGGAVTLTASPSRPFVGFEVDGEMMPYSGMSYSFMPSSEVGASKIVKAVYETNWYVDCVNGDDANTGTASLPKQTIRAATTNALSGDVIHVAPGTYGELEGTQKSTASAVIGTRVVVPADVTVESTDGAGVTFIVGAAATGDHIENATYGLGLNAVRCVYAMAGAVLRGFTLTGGHTAGGSGATRDQNGSAFYSYAERAATIEDCIVSGNDTYRHTIYNAVVNRCKVIGNGAYQGNADGSAGGQCSWYNTLIAKNEGNATVYYPYAFENCTITPDNTWTNGNNNPQVIYNTQCPLINSAILVGRLYRKATEMPVYMTNCIVRSSHTSWTGLPEEQLCDTIITSSVATQLDDEYRPVYGSYVGIDSGNASVSSAALGSKDVYGTPRVLNGAIDIGAVEHDWRPTFNAEIGRRFNLTYASPTVTTNATGEVKLDGDVGALGDRALPVCIAGTVSEAGPYAFTFEMTGGGAAVYVDGVLSGEASGVGEQSIRFNVPDPAAEIRFVFTPDPENPGSAILRKFVGARGFSISFR